MENPVPITFLNDFIFCPASIFFHQLDAVTDKMTYQSTDQINGSASHEKSDTASYSDRSSILQGIYVYSEKYGLYGKIDVFDTRTGILTERKRTIRHIYDGYIFQLYAQYFSLLEMGYSVRKLRLYSMTDNRVYPIVSPAEDADMLCKFEQTIFDVKNFSFSAFTQNNPEKCIHCIYASMCCYTE